LALCDRSFRTVLVSKSYLTMEIEKAVTFTLSALTLEEKTIAQGLLENRQFYEKTSTVSYPIDLPYQASRESSDDENRYGSVDQLSI
jgi:hypothetical protein